MLKFRSQASGGDQPIEHRPSLRRTSAIGLLWVGLCLGAFTGCAGRTHRQDAFPRPFAFATDTLAYSNELYWVYATDPVTGKTTHSQRQPPPTYALHCYVVAKTARLFFQHAQFDPSLPRVSEEAYRALVKK